MEEVLRRNAAEATRFPWSRCILGCIPVPNTEVTLLPCRHILCSDNCATEFLARRKSGSPLSCPTCQCPFSKDELSNKIIPEVEFLEKYPPPLVTDGFICNYCIFNRPATSSCSECPAYLCDPCTMIHPLIKATQRHQIKTLTEPSAVRQQLNESSK